MTLNIRNLSILGTAAVILAIPMLIYGPLPQGHDTEQHLNYTRHFSEQFWGGEWCPRWLAGMNHGLGSPSFFVYPPFPSYVYALLKPAGKVCHFNAFKMGEFLALLGSGICAFLWLNTTASQRVALAGAILYMLMPYHLAVDYYRRTALPECWALVWMPLVLYCSARAMRRERVYLAGLAVAYACLILSHLISVLIFSLIPLITAMTLAARGQKVKSAGRVARGMLLGIGLSCFYLIPALFHAKYFPVSRLYQWSDLQGNLITAGTLFNRNTSTFVHAISLVVLNMIAFCVLCSIIVLAKGDKESRTKILFWIAVSAIPVILMFGPSFPVWKWCPPLFAAVQFPWRFNIVLCLAALAIVTVFLSELPRLSRRSQALSLVLALLFIVPWFMAYGSIWRHYQMEVVPQMPQVNEHDGWFYAWSPAGIDETRALQASTGPQVRFVTGIGTANLLFWKPRYIEFQTDSSTGGWVMIRQFYYPSWRASVVSPHQALAIKAAIPEGLMEVQAPPGRQQIQIEISVGRAERIGCWISVWFALLSVGVAWRQRRERGNSIAALPAKGDS